MTRLVPRNGMIVIDPATSRPLPVDGADVELDTYWLRRRNDGDVTQIDETPQPAPEPVMKEPAPAKPNRKKGTEDK